MNSVNSLFVYNLLLTSRHSRSRGHGKLLPNTSTSGFSLLEMVVVVAILGILVAIQLPNVLGNIEKAKVAGAQAQISNAITECATAKVNGVTEKDLSYARPAMMDIVPSLYNNPPGYRWDTSLRRGCFDMRLIPVDSKGRVKRGEGYPYLYAKIASGGRIVKVADFCKPYKTIDFTKECMSWDPTVRQPGYRTMRNLADPEWAIKSN